MLAQEFQRIWDSLNIDHIDTSALTPARFAAAIAFALKTREDVAVQTALASAPKLHLYRDIFEGTGLKKYLCCPGDFQAARVRFQLRCGTSFLREETGRRDVEAYEEILTFWRRACSTRSTANIAPGHTQSSLWSTS